MQIALRVQPRHGFMAMAMAVAWTLASTTASRAADVRPNVVLIVADDLGWADLGCYASKFYRTPNIDRLASESKRFVQAYAAAPVCSPTRAAILTGKHPARLRLTDWLPGRPDMASQRLLRPAFRQELGLEEVTLAEIFRAAGYATAHIGKWHLGGRGFEPTRQGFDVNIGGDAAGTTLSYFAPFARDEIAMPGLREAPAGEYLPDRLTSEAERFIHEHRSTPFFLYVPHFSVHTPLAAKANVIARYPKWDGTPHGRQENPIYAAMIESLDESVGRIRAALEHAGVASQTVVVFTSDNGGLATLEGPNTPATNNAPLREGKGWLYEGGLRVPLLVGWPGKVAPGVDSTPVWSGDLFPTLAALCGIAETGKVDGDNLAPLLMEGSPLPDRALAWHYPHYSNQSGRPGGAIRQGEWKLIEMYETGRRELFHVVRDPGESTNLADREPKRVAALADALDRWRRTVGAQMPATNPNYRANPQADDGTIVLPARTADVHGVMLRYEPLPHKNTLGYWVRTDDWASWEFEVREAGTFAVEALVGCGERSGGSVVAFRFGDQVLNLTVPVTGGFQRFLPQRLGRVTIERPGRATLEVRVQSKPGLAAMDLREVRLRPVRAEEPAVVVEHVNVYKEDGQFAGWPANHGIWSWGDEILVGFSRGTYKDRGLYHHIDHDRPEEFLLARSLDGGRSWSVEEPRPRGALGGTPGMRHGKMPAELPEEHPALLGEPIDFTHPEFAMTLRMANSNNGQSRYYFSYDRGHNWRGPYQLPLFGQKGVMARTDYLVNGPRDCLVCLTASKENGREGRPFCARTTDGGLTWKFVGYIGTEPAGYAIMPSTVRRSDVQLVTTIRCKEGTKSWIDAYASGDNGQSWSLLSRPEPDTGEGNPPSLLKLADGRLCLIYGVRAKPFGIRARLSGDHGSTWSDAIVFRNDGGSTDLGYVRSVIRPDGKVVAVYYYTDDKTPTRFIAATIWQPPQR